MNHVFRHTAFSAAILVAGLATAVRADDQSKQPLFPAAESQFQFELIFDSDFSDPDSITREGGLWRRENMDASNNSGQHRHAPGRRHAAWYDRFANRTALIENGVLIQRGFVADADLPDFQSRDSENAPRNHPYIDPDPRDEGTINFADFELHTSWFDTFAVKSVDGKQVPVEPGDTVVPKDEFWGQPGKTDTPSPNHVFPPGTMFEIEVNFEGMRALAHRHSFWLMPASAQNFAYDDDPANGLEIDIYEHELTLEPDAIPPRKNASDGNLNEVLLMKCIGGKTNPPSTVNELDPTGNTAIRILGINKGWHRVGLFWTPKVLVWLVDGKPVARDRTLVPQVPMYLILSREANTGATIDNQPTSLQVDGERIPMDAGLFGRNVAAPANRDVIKRGGDDVKVRSVRAWKIQPRG